MTISELPAVEPVVKFHLSLIVSSLGTALSFYRALFGIEPAKCNDDYAKFELEDPPVMFSLVPRAPGPGGSLSHLGFRVSSVEQVRQTQERLAAAGICTQHQCGTVCGYARQDKVWTKDPDGNFWEVYVIEVGLRLPDAAALVDIQRRLEEFGIATQRQEGVECCYSRQTKFRVTDPDRVLWEIYTLHEDIDHSGFDDPPAQVAPAPQNVWEHRLTDPWPERIPHPDRALDEVRLEGAFNCAVRADRLAALAAEVFRVLRPGGKVAVHALVGDRSFPGKLGLPGLASVVQHVPVETEPLGLLKKAGFGGLYYEKLGDIHCFNVNGVELREMRLVGWKSAGASWPSTTVIYKGPFEQVADDDGTVFVRNETTTIGWGQAGRLCLGPAGDQFTFVEASGRG
jgi:catechol 2,3-dioxygenase-like lactoylglutathione lyase family enzyme